MDDNVRRSKRTGKLYIKKPSTDICNAWAKDHYCKRPAGWGTAHPSEGRCKWHGGCAYGRPRKKEFSPSNYLDNDILKILEREAKADPNTLKNLKNEINTVRANLYQYVKSCYTKGELPDPGELQKSIYSLCRLLPLHHKLNRQQEEEEIPTKMIACFTQAVMQILIDCGISEETIRRIRKRIKVVKLEDLKGGKKSKKENSDKPPQWRQDDDSEDED